MSILKQQTFWAFLLAGTLLWSMAPLAKKTMPEICDNAIDDDGDGLIDINDPDCYCPPREPISLIPNPSFEDRNCCPHGRSQLSCADDWLQASEATTDLIATCGWGGWDHLLPPQPFPDGDAIMGFRNGIPYFDESNPGLPNWKEYAGACLRGPLRAGETYRFEFYVGFTMRNSPSTSLYFFGTEDCGYLPFGANDPGTGCPTNAPGWERLGRISISGRNEWLQMELTIIPDFDVNAIAIGPDCSPWYGTIEPYYYFDNLVLAEQSAFEFEISASGNPCSSDFELAGPDRDSLTYQWYLDGVALLGETEAQVNTEFRYGRYQLRLIGPSSCHILDYYDYQPLIVRESIERTICAHDYLDFADQDLNQSGFYRDTLVSSTGCDSIVTLTLSVLPPIRDTVRARILPGETYRTGDRFYQDEGIYDYRLVSRAGCDSLVNLTLEHYRVFIPNAFSPNFDGVNDNFRLFFGPGIVSMTSFQIYDRWGGLVHTAHAGTLLESPPGEIQWAADSGDGQVPAGVYIYHIQLLFDDGQRRQFSGDLMLLR